MKPLTLLASAALLAGIISCDRSATSEPKDLELIFQISGAT